jgi:hypothetical protein
MRKFTAADSEGPFKVEKVRPDSCSAQTARSSKRVLLAVRLNRDLGAVAC